MTDVPLTAAFDGIDITTLLTTDLDRSLALYTTVLDLEVTDSGLIGDPARYAEATGLDVPPTTWVRLDRPGSAGGAVCLVQAGDRTDVSMDDVVRSPGPVAVDFYVRGIDTIVATARDGGWDASDPVDYLLPGTTYPVKEAFIRHVETGTLHALVEYEPTRHRCALAADPGATTSEVVAAVTASTDLAAADAFATDVLGGDRYFSGAFGTGGIAAALRLPEGTSFDMSLFRGPLRRNARMELLGCLEPGRAPRPTSMVWGCAVTDLAALAAVLADSRHGTSSGLTELDVPGRPPDAGSSLVLRSAHGAVFHFWQRE